LTAGRWRSSLSEEADATREDDMAIEDEEKVIRPKAAVGDDLSKLSVRELEERIAAFREEIVRLEQAVAAKNSVKSAADALFRL
jgi:uncharacterized small protein (DUF1192 family)